MADAPWIALLGVTLIVYGLATALWPRWLVAMEQRSIERWYRWLPASWRETWLGYVGSDRHRFWTRAGGVWAMLFGGMMIALAGRAAHLW